MNITLFGATGTIGQRVLREAVDRGFNVTAVARDVSKVPANPKVRAVAGNLLKADEVARLAKGADAVVSAFAPVGGQDIGTLVQSIHSLSTGLRSAGVRRLIVVGGAGSLLTPAGTQVVDSPEFPAAWKGIALAHRDALDVLRKEPPGLDWTYFSPAAFIEPGTRTAKFRRDADRLILNAKGESRISAEDYAVALIDELEHPEYIRRRFTVGYES